MEHQSAQPGRAVRVHAEHVLVGVADRHRPTETLPVGHRALQWQSVQDRRAAGGAGRLDTGVLLLGDVEEVAVDRGDGPCVLAHPGDRLAGGDRAGVEQVGRNSWPVQVHRHHVDPRAAL
ncbi:hypothetical protein OG401_00745 [Kitasatospora purpeofusca]|uniref:hypothetical protein n=1 Tax=Kitasatospora purpeofusca TaxID=67352 RepID=UPI002256CA17|nr:hypothetical protein [Kitasatospora purpeofusca]MCX4682851.1 hypothetical protein [Kitasatospora purpeofusca]